MNEEKLLEALTLLEKAEKMLQFPSTDINFNIIRVEIESVKKKTEVYFKYYNSFQ